MQPRSLFPPVKPMKALSTHSSSLISRLRTFPLTIAVLVASAGLFTLAGCDSLTGADDPEGPLTSGPASLASVPGASSGGGGAETRITDEAADQYDPAVSGDYVVWQDERHGNSDIYLYEISTGTETQITDEESRNQFTPDVSDDYVVWWNDLGDDIYLYEISTGTETQITDEAGDEITPAVSGDYVVWQQDYRPSDIYLYEISTGTETQITDDPAYQVSPDVSGDYIVWKQRYGSWDIYLYEISTGTETRVTTSAAEQGDPAVSGDYVVWQDERHGNSDIYLYEISTGTETRVTTSAAEQGDPAVSGDYVVWQDERHGNSDIYLYEISTGTETRLTTNTFDQRDPAVSGDYVVWQDERHGNSDIYLYDISGGDADDGGGSAPSVSSLLTWHGMDETGQAVTRADAHGATDYSNILDAPTGDVSGLVGNALELGDGDLRTTNFPLDVAQDFTIVTWVHLPSDAQSWDGLPYLWRTGGGPADVRIFAWPQFSSGGYSNPIYLVKLRHEEGVEWLSPPMSLGAWEMMVLRYEAATHTVRLSVNDGADLVEMALPAPLLAGRPSAREVRLDGKGFPMRLDEQSVWQAHLTDEELAWLYNAGGGRAYDDLHEDAPPPPPPPPVCDGTAPPVSSLLTWHSMDETGQAVARADAHGATDYSNIVVAPTGHAAGLVGNAVKLGDGNLRTTNAATPFPLDVTQDFTIVTWMYLPHGTSGAPYLWRTGGGQADLRLSARRSGYLIKLRHEAGVEWFSSSAPNNLGAWKMVVLRYEAATRTMRLRVNDEADLEEWVLPAPLAGPSAREVRIDGRGTPVRLDEQSVWQAHLTDEELAWLYNAGGGRAYDDLYEDDPPGCRPAGE